jgi:hypothetical protein
MKISTEMFWRWEKSCQALLAEHGHTCAEVTSKINAWDVASRLDIPREAYHTDGTINDNHIATALKRIFPNAWN